MAETKLKIILEPDTRKLDRALKGKRIGAEGKVSKEGKKQAKDSGLMVGLTTRLLATVASIGLILTALDFIIRPLAALLTAILTLFFLPLIPIIKPVFTLLGKSIKGWADLAPRISKFMSDLVEGLGRMVSDIVNGLVRLYNIFKGFVKGIATLGLWVWEEIIKPGFSFLLDVGNRIWTEILKPAFDFVKTALRNAANAIINLINKLPWINIPSIRGPGPVPPPQTSIFPPPFVNPFTGQPITQSVTINNPIVKEKSDIKKIVDAVSKVLAAGVNRG